MKKWNQLNDQNKAWLLAVWGYAFMVAGCLGCFWNFSRADSEWPRNNAIPFAWVPLLLGMVPLAWSPFYTRLKGPVTWVPIFWLFGFLLAAVSGLVLILLLIVVLWAVLHVRQILL
jgi:hypothetical protein